MWRSRMFWRLFSTYGILLLSAIGLLGVVIVGRVERHYLEQIEEDLHTRAVLVGQVVHTRRGAQEPPLQQGIKTLGQETATHITLLAEDGKVLADSEHDPQTMENHANRPEVRQSATAADHFGMAVRFSTTLQQRMMYVALAFSRRSQTDAVPNGPVGYVRVALPLDKIQEQLAGLRRIMWTAAVVTGLGAVVLAFWLARRSTQPLQELTAGAERIAAGGYGYRVYAAGRDEVSTLGRTFNHMSERLAVQFAQLEEDRQQLRTILSGMVEGVIALDADQRILFANERAAQLLGFQPQATSGRRLWEVVRQRALQELVQRALAGPEPHEEELNWNAPAFRSVTVHAARLPGSPARGAVLVLHDTSELRRLERLRHEFVANVSHELKTPLSVIKACVETLLEGAVDDPENCGRFLEQIAEQSDRLHALILDLLSLARIESGTEAFEFQPVAVGPVVAACLERHRARAEGSGQRLEAIAPVSIEDRGSRIEDSKPRPERDTLAPTSVDPRSSILDPRDVTAWADEEAVGQILENLVDNALKYTPPGGRISVRWHVEDGQVSLEVEDTGIGIPEQDLPRIFERFYRVDKARSRELGGTGLGLSIVKHLAQAMHGSVRASSRLGQGTTFTVRLPRAPVA
ncbi:MAG TPA: ATP-binding protein [Gemmataceae bacterium]|jgi:two-component system phosphate regulon sensor histidine kinase PhoR|nr:ATP-binding protein [Gemmataceae bacterium]